MSGDRESDAPVHGVGTPYSKGPPIRNFTYKKGCTMFCGRWLRKFVQGKRVGFLATMVQTTSTTAHWAGPRLRLSRYLHGAPDPGRRQHPPCGGATPIPSPFRPLEQRNLPFLAGQSQHLPFLAGQSQRKIPVRITKKVFP